MQLALPLPSPDREQPDAICGEQGRHVCDVEYFHCDAFPELSDLVDGLEALHVGRDWYEVRKCLSGWQIWAGMQTPVSGLEGRA